MAQVQYAMRKRKAPPPPQQLPKFRKVAVHSRRTYTQSDEQYIVHKIISSRKKDGSSEVLTAWRGWAGYNTWEPESNMKSAALLIEDYKRRQPRFDPPSSDLEHFALQTLSVALQRSLNGENDPSFSVPFPEVVFRAKFGHLPLDDQGKSVVSEEEMKVLFPQMFVLEHKNGIDQNKPDYPVKLKRCIHKSGIYSAEYVKVECKKDCRAKPR